MTENGTSTDSSKGESNREEKIIYSNKFTIKTKNRNLLFSNKKKNIVNYGETFHKMGRWKDSVTCTI